MYIISSYFRTKAKMWLDCISCDTEIETTNQHIQGRNFTQDSPLRNFVKQLVSLISITHPNPPIKCTKINNWIPCPNSVNDKSDQMVHLDENVLWLEKVGVCCWWVYFRWWCWDGEERVFGRRRTVVRLGYEIGEMSLDATWDFLKGLKEMLQ